MILKAKKIGKKFHFPHKLQLFHNIDLNIQAGETVAIMGRSGEGKSTLLHILGTLDTPTEGEIEIASKQVTKKNLNEIRNRHLGFVFQSFHLLDDYTVLQNILMPSRIGRNSQPASHAEALLKQVGLLERKNHFGKQLSGGEKQRVAIARALCNNPDILLADEPSGNLDRTTAEGIHQLLLSFAQDRGKTLIVVTHDQELANLCQSIYLLKAGSLEKIK